MNFKLINNLELYKFGNNKNIKILKIIRNMIHHPNSFNLREKDFKILFEMLNIEDHNVWFKKLEDKFKKNEILYASVKTVPLKFYIRIYDFKKPIIINFDFFWIN